MYLKIVNLTPGNLQRTMSIVTDGFKGIDHYVSNVSLPELRSDGGQVERCPPLHVSCLRHLANAIRHAERKKKKSGDKKANPAFHNNQIYKVARSSTEAEKNTRFASLLRDFPSAAAKLKDVDAKKWCLFDMAGCMYGHITSNLVEGENGAIEKIRHEHPYIFIDSYILRLKKRYADLKRDILNLHNDGKKLTVFASNMVKKEMALQHKNTGYRIQPNGSGMWLVWDAESQHRVRHEVSLAKACPGCTPCNVWGQFRLPCRHMFLAMGIAKRELVSSVDKSELYDTYFHPAYILQNSVEVFNEHSDAFNLKMPFCAFGRPVPDVDLCGGGGGGGGASGKEEVMLPPLKYTLEKYKENKKPGRPKKPKRIRSNGDTASGGGQPLRKRSCSKEDTASVGGQPLLKSSTQCCADQQSAEKARAIWNTVILE